MALHFHWPPDFWRRMGWIELRCWLREMHRQQRRQHGGVTAPHSWSGSDRDPWWQQQRRKHKELRGG